MTDYKANECVNSLSCRTTASTRSLLAELFSVVVVLDDYIFCLLHRRSGHRDRSVIVKNLLSLDTNVGAFLGVFVLVFWS